MITFYGPVFLGEASGRAPRGREFACTCVKGVVFPGLKKGDGFSLCLSLFPIFCQVIVPEIRNGERVYVSEICVAITDPEHAGEKEIKKGVCATSFCELLRILFQNAAYHLDMLCSKVEVMVSPMMRFLSRLRWTGFSVCAGEPTLAARIDWLENAGGNRQAHRPRHRQKSMGF